MPHAILYHVAAPARHKPEYSAEAFLLHQPSPHEGDLAYRHILTGFRVINGDPQDSRHVVQARGPVADALGGKTTYHPWRFLLALPWQPVESVFIPSSVKNDPAATRVGMLSESPPQWRAWQPENTDTFLTGFIAASVQGLPHEASLLPRLKQAIRRRLPVEAPLDILTPA